MHVGNVKILWDVDIRTDIVISAHRPDIVIHDSFERSAILIDVAIPADVNIVDKEREKILKYVTGPSKIGHVGTQILTTFQLFLQP